MWCTTVEVQTTFSLHRGSSTVNRNMRPALDAIRCARLALGQDGIAHVAWNGRDVKRFWYRSVFAPARNLLASGDSVDGGSAVAADGTGRGITASISRRSNSGHLGSPGSFYYFPEV